MEFSKDNNTIQILPNDLKIYNDKNIVSLKPEGNITIENNDFSYNTWNNYKTIVNTNSYLGISGSIDLETTGGNISLGNPSDPTFSGRFKHHSIEHGANNSNEDIITSRFIGTQNNNIDNNNSIIRFSGLEIQTSYYNNNIPFWDETLNFFTTKNASISNDNFNSAGNLSASISCKNSLTPTNNERSGSLVINPPNPRLITAYSDSNAFGHQLYTDYIKVENMKLTQHYIPSQQLELNNGNISLTSYYNSNTAGNSYNSSVYSKSTSLNKSTITGLNQVIFDSTGDGSYDWKWGSGIGSFFNYGRGYYEFPDSKLTTWTGNGNKEENTDSYAYDNSLNNTEKQNYRRTIMNNVIMSGMLIENHFEGHNTFLSGVDSPNPFNTDIENKQPPSESLHFITYNSSDKEWQGESSFKGLNGSKLILPNEEQKAYGGEIRMSIHSNGCVGIGTTNSEYLFEVGSNTKMYSVGSFKYFGTYNFLTNYNSSGSVSGHQNQTYGGNIAAGYLNINSKFCGNILAQTLLVNSDERIKINIETVPDKLALQQINELETKYYDYKDPLNKREHKTIGFIAQQTKAVIPNAVKIVKEYIPDELRDISNIEWEYTNNKWKFTIDNLDLSQNNTGYCRFLFTKGNMEEFICLKVESDNKSFLVNHKYDHVYFWGKEINDFHTIDKNMIFALHHSGIQELSRDNDSTKEKIERLENENLELKERLKKIEEKIGL
tara:strand:+ start:11056 stop:13212 length:2157 start_codon:yes stop_codon:yes gene_type:complete